MIANKIMERDVVTCGSSDKILYVCNKITHKKGVDHAVVVNEKNQVVGIVSLRDMTRFKLAMITGTGPRGILQTKIGALMTRNPLCAYEHTYIKVIIGVLISKSINAVPVVDHDIKLKGIILKRDIFPWIKEFLDSNVNNLKKDYLNKITAEEIMTKDPIFCTPDDTAIKVDRMMARYHIGHVPVVKDDKDKEVVGVVSFKDLNPLSSSLSNRSMGGKIREFMSKKLFVVEPKETLYNIITLMNEKDIGSLPVVENIDNKKLLGIICRKDVYMAVSKFMA